jgi:hypothetical protein
MAVGSTRLINLGRRLCIAAFECIFDLVGVTTHPGFLLRKKRIWWVS